jgi:hypothetical protein
MVSVKGTLVMKKVKKTFLLSILLIYGAFLFGASYASNAYAIDFNDYVLDVKALSHGNDIQGVVPVFVIVTYNGAGVDILTAQNFSTKTDAQLVPAGCSALTLDTNEFRNQGDGIYHLGLRPVTTLCAGTYYLPIKVDMRPGVNASGMTVLEIFRFSFDPNLFPWR